jgi:hypothetical protein
MSQGFPSPLPNYCMLSNRSLAQRTCRETGRDVHAFSANDTDALPNARPLPNDDEPTLTIRIPPRRLCSLCSRVYPIIDSQLPKQPSHCRSCQRRERCSHCHLLKKRKHFRNPTHHDRYYFPSLTSLPATLSLSTSCFNERGRN